MPWGWKKNLPVVCMLLYKSMFPSESFDHQSWSWKVVCQGAWEHTFKNIFWLVCQKAFVKKVKDEPKKHYRFTPQ
jgi:hypothetical protein